MVSFSPASSDAILLQVFCLVGHDEWLGCSIVQHSGHLSSCGIKMVQEQSPSVPKLKHPSGWSRVGLGGCDWSLGCHGNLSIRAQRDMAEEFWTAEDTAWAPQVRKQKHSSHYNDQGVQAAGKATRCRMTRNSTAMFSCWKQKFLAIPGTIHKCNMSCAPRCYVWASDWQLFLFKSKSQSVHESVEQTPWDSFCSSCAETLTLYGYSLHMDFHLAECLS